MREIEKLKEEILKDYPRLDEESSFTFRCHPGVSCFNDCCGDVNIFLTPYDIIRLKNNLRLSSQEFLDRHTISPFDQNLKYPVILLKMGDDDKKSCPFVGQQGCQVYPDRPWSCRMYPLGLASPGQDSESLDKEFYFLLKEGVCKGFDESRKQTVHEWLADQGIDEYNRMGEDFKNITLHRYFQEGHNLTPEKVEMFFLACYNIDKFRDFLFTSSFFDKFEIEEAERNRITEDDVELLKFGYRWLKFVLFGEKTLTIRGDVLEAKRRELEKKQQQ